MTTIQFGAGGQRLNAESASNIKIGTVLTSTPPSTTQLPRDLSLVTHIHPSPQGGVDLTISTVQVPRIETGTSAKVQVRPEASNPQLYIFG
jgi:hypothetical protein